MHMSLVAHISLTVAISCCILDRTLPRPWPNNPRADSDGVYFRVASLCAFDHLKYHLSSLQRCLRPTHAEFGPCALQVCNKSQSGTCVFKARHPQRTTTTTPPCRTVAIACWKQPTQPYSCLAAQERPAFGCYIVAIRQLSYSLRLSRVSATLRRPPKTGGYAPTHSVSRPPHTPIMVSGTYDTVHTTASYPATTDRCRARAERCSPPPHEH